MIPRSLARRWSILILPAFLLLAGCPFSPEKKDPVDPPPDSEYLALTSISNVISNLKKSYERMNYPEYSKLLADDFEYVFAPEDVGGPNNIPESWGKADELLSAEHMFSSQPNKDGYRADDIKLTFTAGSEETTPLDPTWKLVKLTQIHLMVNTNHPEKGQLLYEATNDQAWLYFLQTTEVDPTSGKKLWKIVRWEDKPIGAIAANS